MLLASASSVCGRPDPQVSFVILCSQIGVESKKRRSKPCQTRQVRMAKSHPLGLRNKGCGIVEEENPEFLRTPRKTHLYRFNKWKETLVSQRTRNERGAPRMGRGHRNCCGALLRGTDEGVCPHVVRGQLSVRDTRARFQVSGFQRQRQKPRPLCGYGSYTASRAKAPARTHGNQRPRTRVCAPQR